MFSRLLFTEESVLQHELGRGQLAFKWHKRSKHPAAAASSTAAMSSSTDKNHAEQSPSPKKNGENVKDGSMDSSKGEAETLASTSSGEIERANQCSIHAIIIK